MTTTLTGRRAVVTGASRGIGRAIALDLAASGAYVICASTREGGCDGTVAELSAKGGVGEAMVVDVADEASVSAFAEEVLAGGAPSILINNAGVTRDGMFLRMSTDDLDSVLSVNLRGVLLVCRAFARQLTKAETPRIVTIGSVVGITGNAGQVNYAASKAGLVGMTKALAKELASRGVTVNLVAPGFIDTDMTSGLPEAVRDGALQAIPLGRFGSSADITGVVRYLCSDAGSYVTGQVLVVDGGMTM